MSQLCVVCGCESDQGQTCVNCVNHTRNLLTDIHDGWQTLPDAIRTLTGINYHHAPGGDHDTTVPGGDALVMLSPGTGDNPTSLAGHRPHPADHRTDDPPSLAGELATLEDDWRHTIGAEAAPYDPSVTKSIQWMVANLEQVTRTHPDFPTVITELRDLKTRVTTVTGTSTAPVPVDAAACLDCGGTLVRRWTTDGLDDTVECHACGRVYTDAGYRLALLDKIRTAPHTAPDALITATDAGHVFPDLAPGTIWQWAHRGHLTPAGRNTRGEPTYRIADLATLHAERIGA